MKISTYKEKGNLDYRLINAVLDQLSIEDDGGGTLEDIANHGISGGFTGFVYYAETAQFYADNQELIRDQLKEEAESYGSDSAISLVMSFNCINDVIYGETTEDEVGETLYSLNHDQQVANCLAWYAAETVARDYVDIKEEARQ